MTREPSVERAIRGVMHWCGLYTRGLPTEVARERCEEILADMADEEIWAAENHIGTRELARSIHWRAIRGAFADVLWRVSWSDMSKGFGLVCAVSWSFTFVVLFAASSSIAIAALTLARVGLASPDSVTAILVLAGVVCGLALVARNLSRWLGVLCLLGAQLLVISRGLPSIARTTTILHLMSTSGSGWTVLQLLMIGGSMLVLGSAALWWSPLSGVARKAAP